MENKDVERKLQESIEKTEARPFDEVWEEIKDRIQPTPIRSKRKKRWVVAAVSAAVACGVICAVTLPLLNPAPVTNGPTTYLRDQLQVVPADVGEFNHAFAEEKIDCVDFSEYVVVSTCLYKTSKGIAKGGKLELADEVNNSTFYLTMQLYSMDVVVDKREEVVFDKHYIVGNTSIEYRIKETYPEDGVYIYDIRTEHNSTQYYMEYTCFSEDITPFLSEFFG